MHDLNRQKIGDQQQRENSDEAEFYDNDILGDSRNHTNNLMTVEAQLRAEESNDFRHRKTEANETTKAPGSAIHELENLYGDQYEYDNGSKALAS